MSKRKLERRSWTIEEKAAFLAEYDHAPHGDKQRVLAVWDLTTAYVARWREELARHTGAPTGPVGLFNLPKEKVVIEVSAEPDTDLLINEALDHIDDAEKIINTCRSRILAGMNGIVTKKYDASLVSAADMLKIARLDLVMASMCNEIR